MAGRRKDSPNADEQADRSSRRQRDEAALLERIEEGGIESVMDAYLPSILTTLERAAKSSDEKVSVPAAKAMFDLRKQLVGGGEPDVIEYRTVALPPDFEFVPAGPREYVEPPEELE